MRVVIADDELLLREGLGRLLSEVGFEVVGTAAESTSLHRAVNETLPDYYNIVVAGQLATDRALNNTQSTNQHQYSWSYVSSYDFDQGALKGWTVGGALRYLGRALAGYYGDAATLNSAGQIGDGTMTQRNTPAAVSGITTATDVVAGAAHTTARSEQEASSAFTRA